MPLRPRAELSPASPARAQERNRRDKAAGRLRQKVAARMQSEVLAELRQYRSVSITNNHSGAGPVFYGGTTISGTTSLVIHTVKSAEQGVQNSEAHLLLPTAPSGTDSFHSTQVHPTPFNQGAAAFERDADANDLRTATAGAAGNTEFGTDVCLCVWQRV